MQRSAAMKRTGFARKQYERKPSAPPTPIPPELAARISHGHAQLFAVPKGPEPVRSEPYRRLVASLPCVHCGIRQHSQAAHPNSDKAKGQKLDDRLCFPLCADRPGVRGCHPLFDQYLLYPRQICRSVERGWTRRTVDTITRAGQWPVGVAELPTHEELYACTI